MSIIETNGSAEYEHTNRTTTYHELSGLELLKVHRAEAAAKEQELRSTLMNDLRQQEDIAKAAQAHAAAIRAELGLDDAPAPNRRARKAAKKATKRASTPPVAAKPKAGRLARRSDEEITGYVAQLVALVGQHDGGLGAEAICKELKLQKKELPRIIKKALEEKAIISTGKQRGTKYATPESAS